VPEVGKRALVDVVRRVHRPPGKTGVFLICYDEDYARRHADTINAENVAVGPVRDLLLVEAAKITLDEAVNLLIKHAYANSPTVEVITQGGQPFLRQVD
jgi:hypothetical protein